MKVKLLHKDAIVPSYAKTGDAGMDLYSIEQVWIPARARAVVKTGIAIELPLMYEAQIRPRSGLAAKHGITVLNAPGTIDSGYRGEIMIILLNTSAEAYMINVGDRIAQMVIAEYVHTSIRVVEELSETQRGTGGLGSTGKN